MIKSYTRSEERDITLKFISQPLLEHVPNVLVNMIIEYTDDRDCAHLRCEMYTNMNNMDLSSFYPLMKIRFESECCYRQPLLHYTWFFDFPQTFQDYLLMTGYGQAIHEVTSTSTSDAVTSTSNIVTSDKICEDALESELCLQIRAPYTYKCTCDRDEWYDGDCEYAWSCDCYERYKATHNEFIPLTFNQVFHNFCALPYHLKEWAISHNSPAFQRMFTLLIPPENRGNRTLKKKFVDLDDLGTWLTANKHWLDEDNMARFKGYIHRNAKLLYTTIINKGAFKTVDYGIDHEKCNKFIRGNETWIDWQMLHRINKRFLSPIVSSVLGIKLGKPLPEREYQTYDNYTQVRTNNLNVNKLLANKFKVKVIPFKVQEPEDEVTIRARLIKKHQEQEAAREAAKLAKLHEVSKSEVQVKTFRIGCYKY
jgi:hypothetical protein